jgi:anti-sigma B factor antagonist
MQEVVPMTAETLQTEVTHTGDGLVVALVGEVDLSTCPVARSLFDSIDWSSLAHLTVDLRRVQFMDSSGLHLLLGVRDAARAGAVSLDLIAGPDAVRRVFDLTGTASQFTWVDSLPTMRGRRGLAARRPRTAVLAPFTSVESL